MCHDTGAVRGLKTRVLSNIRRDLRRDWNTRRGERNSRASTEWVMEGGSDRSSILLKAVIENLLQVYQLIRMAIEFA